MRPIFTRNGYALEEVISALQKEIRRGNEEQAHYWALELTPKFEVYLWRRLCIIANEDVGLANPQLLALVPVQRALYFDLRENGNGKSGCRLVLANTILALCRSPKSRLADVFNCAVEQDKFKGEKRPIPDYALDKHTARGRALGRGFEHWREEGVQLHPAGQDALCADTGEYERRAFDHWLEKTGSFVEEPWPKRKGGRSEPEEEQLALF